MKIVGLTGGIGTGKSLVATVFETLGIPVFKADEAGRKVLDTDPLVKQAVVALLGSRAYAGDKPDRTYIASVVFSDPQKLQQLNEIIHPAVGRAFAEWFTSENNKAPYCLREAAILFESGAYRDCDKVICISAPEALRVERVMQRDLVAEGEVRARMAQQMPQQEKESRSDFIIFNDGTQAVIPQVVAVHQKLKSLA